MDSINLDKLASLAHIDIPLSERQSITQDIQSIFAMIDEFSSVDTDELTPLYHPLELIQVLHQDSCEAQINKDEIMACASEIDAQQGMYITPRVIE